MPVVWHVRDRIAPDYLPSPAVWLVRRCARWFPSALIANSAATRATLGRTARPVTVIPSPVDVRLPAAPPRGPLTVGAVGRLAPWKGQHLFLGAFAEAFPAGPERAVVVGEGAVRRAGVRGPAAAAGRRAGDRRSGRIPWIPADVAAELAAMDVLVHSSTIPEPFGQVVVEGMAAGLPVVAADAGGPAEIVRDDVDGLLYPMGDQGAAGGGAAAARRRRRPATPARGRRADDRAQIHARGGGGRRHAGLPQTCWHGAEPAAGARAGAAARLTRRSHVRDHRVRGPRRGRRGRAGPSRRHAAGAPRT